MLVFSDLIQIIESISIVRPPTLCTNHLCGGEAKRHGGKESPLFSRDCQLTTGLQRLRTPEPPRPARDQRETAQAGLPERMSAREVTIGLLAPGDSLSASA
eukprot:scaffold256702_cov25-Prasinocladus_malaysianus.AAC.1